MCHFLTATAGGIRDAAALERWAGQCGLGWTVIENPTVRPLLLQGERYVLTTRGHCDCATDIGLKSRLPRVPAVSESDLSALRKKGWTAARIERWRQDKERNLHRKQERNLQLSSEGGSVQCWSEFILQVLGQELADRVGVLLHWYQHGVENENLSGVGAVWVPREDVTNEFLLRIRSDVLYRFSRLPIANL